MKSPAEQWGVGWIRDRQGSRGQPASAQSERSWSSAACLPSVAPLPRRSRRCSDLMPRRAGPLSRRRPTSRSEAVQRAMGRRLRPPLPLPVRRSRLPQHPIPSLAPTQSPGLHPPQNALRCLPRPHAAPRSQVRSCSRGEGTYPTVSEPSWPPRSPASRIEGPTAGSRPSRAHFSRWWPSVQGCLTVAVGRAAQER